MNFAVFVIAKLICFNYISSLLNLFLNQQLGDPKVRALADLLQKSNSSYYQSFKNIFEDVVAGKSCFPVALFTIIITAEHLYFN